MLVVLARPCHLGALLPQDLYAQQGAQGQMKCAGRIGGEIGGKGEGDVSFLPPSRMNWGKEKRRRTRNCSGDSFMRHSCSVKCVGYCFEAIWSGNEWKEPRLARIEGLAMRRAEARTVVDARTAVRGERARVEKSVVARRASIKRDRAKVNRVARAGGEGELGGSTSLFRLARCRRNLHMLFIAGTLAASGR